jgi:hypothetical protein
MAADVREEFDVNSSLRWFVCGACRHVWHLPARVHDSLLPLRR